MSDRQLLVMMTALLAIVFLYLVYRVVIHGFSRYSGSSARLSGCRVYPSGPCSPHGPLGQPLGTTASIIRP